MLFVKGVSKLADCQTISSVENMMLLAIIMDIINVVCILDKYHSILHFHDMYTIFANRHVS
jgi:hypothetical protein